MTGFRLYGIELLPPRRTPPHLRAHVDPISFANAFHRGAVIYNAAGRRIGLPVPAAERAADEARLVEALRSVPGGRSLAASATPADRMAALAAQIAELPVDGEPEPGTRSLRCRICDALWMRCGGC